MAQTIDIKQRDFNELVFDQRNKSYGAYMLRKRYADTILISLAIGVAIVGIAVAIPYISSLFASNETEVVVPIDTTLAPPPIDETAEEILPPPPPPQEAPAQEQVKSVEFTTPVVTADNVETITTTDDMRNVNPGTTTQDGADGFASLPEGDGTGKKEVEDSGPKVFTIVEVMPSFVGGDKALAKYLQDNIKYPERAKQMNVEGRVYVSFVVDAFGNITNVTLQRGIAGGCNEEALKVVKNMPRWNPGKQGGRAVPVQFNLPIEFSLQ